MVDHANLKETNSAEGLVSPANGLTLSQTARLKAGIYKKVSSYIFMCPPQRLAEIFQSMQFHDNVEYSDEDFVENFSDSFK